MEEELAALKRTLISLVVSSPTTMTVNNLVKDYRNMVGGVLPVSKFGYKDYITFLKERCLDIFVVEGSSRDPVLTPKVTNNLKHIDKMVQKQKVQSSTRYKGKRRSVPGAVNPPPQKNLISETFRLNNVHPPQNNYNKPSVYRDTTPIHRAEPKASPIKETTVPNPLLMENTKHNGFKQEEVAPSNGNEYEDKENINNSSERTSSALSKFYKKRLPRFSSEMDLQDNDADGSSKGSNDSGAHSSCSSASKLEEMKNGIVELIRDSAEGVWFTDLMRLYKERYGRELSLHRFGHTSLGNLVSSLKDRVAVTRPDPLGDYLLQDPESAATAKRGRGLPLPLRRSARHHSTRDLNTNPDDALPGIEIDADVYPADSMHYLERIPSADLSALAGGSQLEVLIGEVYSPSHFWLQQVGPEHNLAMEAVMDRMNEHYVTDTRELVPGALRVGQYCAALYEKDWHRSLIVKIVDSDTVKVRHVDYGTVDTVATCSLRYLPREFGELRAQAVRARLAACRPSARGQRWTHAAAADFLRAVRDKRLYANIVAVDREEDIVETFLTDTSGATDVCLTRALVRLGHADPRHDSALARDESYLYPRFDALETGSTPNYAEIRRLLHDGIELDFVDAYRRHVPAPSGVPLNPPSPPPPPMELVNRVPLMRLESPPPASPEEPHLSPTAQFLPSQSSLSHHQPTQPLLPQYQNTQPQNQAAQPLQQMTQPQYQVTQPQHQMTQPQYQVAQPQHQMTQPQYQVAQPQHQMTQPQYQAAQPQYEMTQPQYQIAQPQHQMTQPQYQAVQPQHQMTQPQYQAAQPHHQMTQPQYQAAQIQHQVTIPQYRTNQPQHQTGQDFLSQFQKLQVREVSQCQTSQPPISQFQTTQSQYQTTQSQYQTVQALLSAQLQTPQPPHSQYQTRPPPPSQVQTTQSATFQLHSQCKTIQSSQYRPTHLQVQSMISPLQSQSVQNSLSQLQSVQPRSTIQMMHPSLQQSQMVHQSPRPSPQPTLPQPPMQRPVHPPLAPSQDLHSSVAQTRSSRPCVLPTLPVRPRQLLTPPPVRPALLPTPAPPQPILLPTVQPTPSSTPPLAQPSVQPTSSRVPPPLSSTAAQPPPSAPAQTALPTAPPGFKSPGAVPSPALNEVRLTEEEWLVLAHLRATDPAAAEWFLTVTAWRAVNAHRNAAPQPTSPFESTPAVESAGRRTAAADFLK